MDAHSTSKLRTQLEIGLQALLASQETIEAALKPMSQMLYQRYKALIAAGFSKEESLEIIKARGLE